MRAEMKLATGIVPVALGVAMALVSGMVKAEEKAQQVQAGTAVSAKTTQPSVGHRKEWRITEVSNKTGQTFQVNTDWQWVVGDYIRTRSSTGMRDPDNNFGANEDIDMYSAFCKKYRVAPDGNEKFLGEFADCEKNDGGYFHKATEADIGYRFKFVMWWETMSSTTPGYTASPSKTLEQVIITPPVSSTLLRAAYAEVNGKKIKVDRGDPNNAHDDTIYLPSAFAGASFKVYIEGGNPGYKLGSAGSDAHNYTTIGNTDPTNHNALITVKDNFVNSANGTLTYSIIDGGGVAGGNVINFKIKVTEMFLSKTYKKNWNDARTDCESGGYVFPYLGQSGSNGDPGSQAPGSLSNSTLFWGGYSKYSFPNASEYHWTRTESDSMNGIAFKLDQPNSIISGYADKRSLYHFVCKKVF